MHKGLRVLVLAGLFAGITAAPALAVSPENPNCWGTVTSQRAVAYGDIGEHSSSQDEPRLGLGNVARLLGFDHLSAFGSAAAGLDDTVGQDPLGATHCP